jgi:hypothetical protein
LSCPKCTLGIGSAVSHNSQIAAGFQLLQEKGLLEITGCAYHPMQSDNTYEHNVCVLVTFEDGRRLLYDMADGYEHLQRKWVIDHQLEALHRCFKRSYAPAFYRGMKNAKKMRPLGLNFFVSCNNNPFDALRRRPRRSVPEPQESHNRFDSYNALFYTRVWETVGIHPRWSPASFPFLTEAQARREAEERAEDRERVNRMRIDCIRALREALGERFCGGVQNSLQAKKSCPDLILPDEMTQRQYFLSLLRQNFICLANDGLYHSIGWKMAEYAANARAIVTETLKYELPGNFSEGQNYLSFASPEECTAQTSRLLDDTALIHRMEENNFTYYCDYARPEGMVRHSLQEAMPELFGESAASRER